MIFLSRANLRPKEQDPVGNNPPVQRSIALKSDKE
jgi:hypothetical protein